MGSIQRKIKNLDISPPDAEMFAMWRAVFALAHVDGAVAPEEIGFLTQALDIFKFSDEQQAVIFRDLTDKGDVAALFTAIKNSDLRGLFFRLARILIWCDGFMHEHELETIEKIRASLGASAVEYEADWKWMHRKPDLPLGEAAKDMNEETVMHLLIQMEAFYDSKGQAA